MEETNKKMDHILNTLVGFKQEFNGFQKEFSGFKDEFQSFKGQTNEKLDRIEGTLLRIEKDQPEDITAMLQQINNKLDKRDAQTQALNKRVFTVESEIERLTHR